MVHVLCGECVLLGTHSSMPDLPDNLNLIHGPYVESLQTYGSNIMIVKLMHASILLVEHDLPTQREEWGCLITE